MLDPTTFIAVRDAEGKVVRVRLRRGTRLRVGQPLGTINRMYPVHMNLGPPGAELNPLALPFNGFTDRAAPRIERDGVQLFDESGARLTSKRGGRLLLRGRVRIVVDAVDQLLPRECGHPRFVRQAARADFGNDHQSWRIRMQRLADRARVAGRTPFRTGNLLSP